MNNLIFDRSSMELVYPVALFCSFLQECGIPVDVESVVDLDRDKPADFAFLEHFPGTANHGFKAVVVINGEELSTTAGSINECL